MHQFEEPRFDEAEQRRIFARAAELQRQEGLAMSASDLEQVAMEAGIDPRFIRRAMAEAKEKPVEPRTSSLPLYILGTFLFSQMYTLSTTLRGGAAYLYVAFTLAIFLGIAWSRTPRERAVPYLVLVVWSAIVFGFLQLFGGNAMGEMGLVYTVRIVALQAFLVVAGQGLSLISKKIVRRPASPGKVEA